MEQGHHPQSDAHVPNLGLESEVTNRIAKETYLSPKKAILESFETDFNMNNEVRNRFKYCKGKPVFRVSNAGYSHQGLRVRGSCIVCKKRTNWYCIECRNWGCHNRSESTVKRIVDANVNHIGHRITAVKSCFMHCSNLRVIICV